MQVSYFLTTFYNTYADRIFTKRRNLLLSAYIVKQPKQQSRLYVMRRKVNWRQ